jgi:hypothetical protein
MPTGSLRRHDWRPFPEACSFVRSLGLRSFDEWQRWAKSQARPGDIPSNPNLAYPGHWTDWADWLGTRPRGQWRPFDEARRFVRSLGLRSHKASCEWAKSPARPRDIPSNPNLAYTGQWEGLADWLGTRRRGQWRPSAEARAYVRSVSLTPTARATELCRRSEALRLVYQKLRGRYSQLHEEETRDRRNAQQARDRAAQVRAEHRRLIDEGRVRRDGLPGR